MNNITPMGYMELKQGAPKAQNTSNFAPNAKSEKYYDSGWQKDNNGRNHSTSFRHGLGTTPRLVEIFFSPTGDTSQAYPLRWSWSLGTGFSGNPVTIKYTTEQIVMHIYAGAPLHAVWDANSNEWDGYTTGYWRVIAWL